MLNSATKIHRDLVSDNLPFTNFQHVNMGQSRSPNVTCQISQFIASGQEQGIDGGKINGDDMGQAHLQSKRNFFRGDLGQVNVDVRQHYSGAYGSGDFSFVLRTNKAQYGSSNKARYLARGLSQESEFNTQSEYNSRVLLSNKLTEETDLGEKKKLI